MRPIWDIKNSSTESHIILEFHDGVRFSNGEWSSFHDDRTGVDTGREHEQVLWDKLVEQLILDGSQVSAGIWTLDTSLFLRKPPRYVIHPIEPSGRKLAYIFNRTWSGGDGIGVDLLFVGGDAADHAESRLLDNCSQLNGLNNIIFIDLDDKKLIERSPPLVETASRFDSLLIAGHYVLFYVQKVGAENRDARLDQIITQIRPLAEIFGLDLPEF